MQLEGLKYVSKKMSQILRRLLFIHETPNGEVNSWQSLPKTSIPDRLFKKAYSIYSELSSISRGLFIHPQPKDRTVLLLTGGGR